MKILIFKGINTYKVNVIHMKDNKAEAIFGRLKAKGKGRVRKKDLVPMLLTPLMGGRMPKKERVLQGFGWLKEEYPDVSRDELAKMQAILYPLACKVLSNEEMKEVKEVVGMTLLGQMLMEDGIKKGRQEERKQGVNALITTCRELGLNREETSEILKKRFQVSSLSASEYMKEYWK